MEAIYQKAGRNLCDQIAIEKGGLEKMGDLFGNGTPPPGALTSMTPNSALLQLKACF
jgi:hypothetical protein